MTDNASYTSSLVGTLLVASPHLQDDRFAKTVIYLCGHDQNGAMGLVVNRILPTVTFQDLMDQLDLHGEQMHAPTIPIYCGGPVELGRGFVVHTPDYLHESTIHLPAGVCVTATVDVIKAIAMGTGPRHHLVTLGYAGWGPGQLESELQRNDWLQVNSSQDILFSPAMENKWEKVFRQVGIDPLMWAPTVGHA